MSSKFKHLLNPFDKRNPLRPDNLAKDPLGLSAQDLLTDPKKQDAPAVAADGTFASPTTGYQRAYNAFIKQGSPGSNGAARGSAAWNNAFNAWIGPILEKRGAYDLADSGKIADPIDAVEDSWFTDGGVGTPGVSVDGTEEVPLEQDLLDRTLSNYVYPALDEDKANQAKFKAILESYKPAIDANRSLVNKLATEDGTTGHSQLATQELSNLDAALQTALGATGERQATKLGAIDASLEEVLAAVAAQQQGKSANLDTALAEYLASIDGRQAEKLAALTPLAQARLEGADTISVAASLAEQEARDKIIADLAAQGYIGGSSFSDASLARATADARQEGAKAMAAAKTANASDVLDVNNETSDATYGARNEVTTKRLGVNDAAADAIFANTSGASAARLGVNNEAADAIWDATNWGANQRLAYLDADTKRRLSNLETPFTLATDEVGLKTAIDDAGWAGLKRSLGVLDWWKLSQANGGGSVNAAPTNVDTTPSAAGVLGPSLVNAGLSIAQSNNWWQTPKKDYATGNGDNQYTS